MDIDILMWNNGVNPLHPPMGDGKIFGQLQGPETTVATGGWAVYGNSWNKSQKWVMKWKGASAEGSQELIKMANKKDINSLLHDFIQLELGRGLGIIKNHSTIHAQQLGNVASARALSSKSTEEKQQWLEEIEASAPDLSRVLRRYIGLFGLGRSTKGREALEYYSLTGDPNPRTRTHIKQQLSMARRGSSVTQTSRGGGVSEQGLSRQ